MPESEKQVNEQVIKNSKQDENRSDLLFYKSGYKYIVQKRMRLQLPFPFHPQKDATVLGPDGQVIAKLMTSGLLIIEPGYAYDGPSGLAFDTRTFMGPSCVHDIIYQMIRLGELPHYWKSYGDTIMNMLCLGAGMCRFRAWYTCRAVRRYADFATRPESEPAMKTAPLRFPRKSQ